MAGWSSKYAHKGNCGGRRKKIAVAEMIASKREALAVVQARLAEATAAGREDGISVHSRVLANVQATLAEYEALAAGGVQWV